MRAYELLESKQTATLGGFTVTPLNIQDQEIDERIGQVKDGYRLYSKKGKNLGTFGSRAGAEKHEREVQYFKHRGMAEGSAETPQQQQVRAAINKGMAADKQTSKDEFQSRQQTGVARTGTPPPGGWWDPNTFVAGRLQGIDSIDPDGTVVIDNNSVYRDDAVAWVKRMATMGGMPGVRTKIKTTPIIHSASSGVAEGKADYNFDAEDLKRLERIRDLPTLKAQALALIAKPSAKPMKPEKVEWFKNALENMNSPLKVIKLMYDLLLSGEGHSVVGSKASMNPNTYRQRFGEDVDEALKVAAPTTSWSRKDVHDYMDRIKTGTTTKADKFKPIIHGSNVKALIKSDNPEDKWDLDDFAQQITTPPTQILGTNAKMAKSKEEGAITYDLTLPALSGIVVDEESGEFVEVKTCPGAGECQIFCYARKGGYRMFPASSMSAARALNFLMNHPAEYMAMFNSEVKQAQARAGKAGVKLLVRIHDAGDFFSKEYYSLAMDVAIDNPDATFYFYTKMGEIVTDTNAPKNVVGQFSGGAQSKQNKIVKLHKDAGKHVKDAIQLGKDEFRGLFKTDANGKYAKDAKGRTQVSSPEAWEKFKQYLGARYSVDPDSVITYDQMVRIPEGPTPKWNVVVFPAGHGDLGAPRLDVQNQFLMFH